MERRAAFKKPLDVARSPLLERELERECVTEIEVIAAFVRRSPAEIPSLKSDGERLFSGKTIVAEWDGEKIRIAPKNGDSEGPVIQNILATLVTLQIHKERILRLLMRRASEAALRLRNGDWHPSGAQKISGELDLK